MIRLNSSFRALPLEAALERAKAAAVACGISRVTDVTRLDRVGIPVYASVRPAAHPDSLCVNAGKGFLPLEACVGAYMEAVEYARADPQHSSLPVYRARVDQLLGGRGRRANEVLTLCPLVGAEVSADNQVQCVEAADLEGCLALVPAELVWYPFRLPAHQTIFANSTNGLASGSTVAEASVHGLCEVIERDVASFRRLGARTQTVDPATLPAALRRVVDALEANGFELALEFAPNPLGVAWFAATLWERGCLDPLFVCEGQGCHLDPAIAASRAISESAQSRLSLIHGARDDLDRRVVRFAGMQESRRRSYARTLIARARAGRKAMSNYSSIPDGARDCRTLDELLDMLRRRLESAGIRRVFSIALTPPDAPVQVVRVIAPRLEHFTFEAPRIGERLARYASRN